MSDLPTYCTKCAAPINPGDAFCAACGQPVTPPAQSGAITRTDAKMIAREQKHADGSYLIGGLLWIGFAIVVSVVLLVLMPDFSPGLALIIGGIVGVFPAFAVVERMIR